MNRFQFPDVKNSHSPRLTLHPRYYDAQPLSDIAKAYNEKKRLEKVKEKKKI